MKKIKNIWFLVLLYENVQLFDVFLQLI